MSISDETTYQSDIKPPCDCMILDLGVWPTVVHCDLHAAAEGMRDALRVAVGRLSDIAADHGVRSEATLALLTHTIELAGG